VTPAKRLFRIENLSCVRGQRLLFQNISFGVAAGGAVHLRGPNGAGKTSLLRILAGALPYETGRLTWEGEDFLKEGVRAHAARFSYLPSDDRYLKALETARENLLFWAKLWNIKEADAVVCRALEAFGLLALADRPVRVFSAGQKRRLSLARLLPGDAWLWLLDEPLNGLDTAATALFYTALRQHLARGGMAVIASHLPLALEGVSLAQVDIARPARQKEQAA
jgi:heme exporter protein A